MPILRGGNLIVAEQGIRDGVRQVLLPLWNAWYFFTLYADAAAAGRATRRSGRPPRPTSLDRYLLAKTHDLVVDVETQLDAYDIAGACESVREHLDVLTNWYVRRSRDRFWAATRPSSHALRHALDGAGGALPGSPRRCCRWSPRRSGAG